MVSSASLSPDFSALKNHSLFCFLTELALGLECQLVMVGGAVRQWVLTDSLANDLDFCLISQNQLPVAQTFAQLFSSATGGTLVPLDEEAGIYRVVVKVQKADKAQEADDESSDCDLMTFDFSDALEHCLETDLARRDLTVNALAWDVAEDVFIDQFDGVSDLTLGRIRMIQAKNFQDDPLRVLRVFRFAAKLQAEVIDPETLKACLIALPLLSQVAGERIQVELMKMLDAPRCFPTLEIMGETGVLEAIIPEMTAMRQVGPNEHHHLPLFVHTLELVNQFELEYGNFPADVQRHLEEPMQAGCGRRAFLKLACLLHDIGKPETMVTYEDNPDSKRTVTFYGHDKVSETLSEGLLQRLKFSSASGDYVKKLVRWHLYPAQFDIETSSRQSILKLFRKMGDCTWDVLALSLADRLSTKGPAITEAMIQASIQNHVALMKAYGEELENLSQPPILNGHQIMQRFNVGPGAHLKTALGLLVEAQQLGDVSSEMDAFTWLEKKQTEWLPVQAP
jgi:poly(A) polymerase